MTDFGAPTQCRSTFGGRGEFDGDDDRAVPPAARRRRVHAARICARSTPGGATAARDIVVENNYVDVARRHRPAGRLGDARRRPVLARLSRATTAARRSTRASASCGAIVDQPAPRVRHRRISRLGPAVGRVPAHGRVPRPVGFGGMTIDDGVALRRAVPDGDRVAAVRRHRRAARRRRRWRRAAGTITGAAFVGWDSTYSFNADGRRIPVEKVSTFSRTRARRCPGIAEFSAQRQRARSIEPRNDYRFRVNDLFVGEEGVGQVTGSLALRGTELSGEIDAASPRLAITGDRAHRASRRRPTRRSSSASTTCRSIPTSGCSCRGCRRSRPRSRADRSASPAG